MKAQTVIIKWGGAVWKHTGPFTYFRDNDRVAWNDVPLPVRFLFSEALVGEAGDAAFN